MYIKQVRKERAGSESNAFSTVSMSTSSTKSKAEGGAPLIPRSLFLTRTLSSSSLFHLINRSSSRASSPTRTRRCRRPSAPGSMSSVSFFFSCR